MVRWLSSCFERRKAPPSLESYDGSNDERSAPAGYRAVDDVNPAKCVFCNVTSEHFNIILEDKDFVCFTDRSPAASVHLLVIPRIHIANVQSLTQRETDLVRQMHLMGNNALDIVAKRHQNRNPAHEINHVQAERRFGFHIPPFRSVDHLHLHCLQLPFKTAFKALKYRVAEPPSKEYIKGWSWFADYAQTCTLLLAGRKVQVASC